MNHRITPLLLAALTFTLSTTARGADTRTYDLVTTDGNRIPATIIWENISGLGKIWGTIDYAAGSLAFNGTNSRSGYISFTTDNGVRGDFNKQTVGNGFVWVGQFHFTGHSESVQLVPTNRPKPGVAPAPAPPKPAGATVNRYTAIDGSGGQAQVTITWSNIKGLGPISGQFIRNGNAVSFDGENSSSGYIWFRDTAGNYYEMRKGAPVGGKVRWTGTVTGSSGQSDSLWLTEN